MHEVATKGGYAETATVLNKNKELATMIQRPNPITVAAMAASLAPVVAFGAPPVPYGGWSATNGAIDTTASCSGAGITCNTLTEGNGMIQQQITTPDYEYIRLIVVDPTATGSAGDLAFLSESVIPFALNNDGVSQGLASQQIVRDSAGGLESVAEIQTGHMKFNNPALRNVFDQSFGQDTTAEERWNTRLSQTLNQGDLSSSFDFTNYTQFATGQAATPDTSEVIGFKLDMDQILTLTDPNSTDPAPTQNFVQRQRGGVQGNSTFTFPGGAGYLAGEPITPAGTMTLGGTTVAWAQGDTVKTTFLNQGGTPGANIGLVGFTYQGVQNLSNDTQSSQFLFGDADSPFGWDSDTFGPMPVLP